MKFVLEINCDSDDMSDGSGISRALQNVARTIDGGLTYTEEKDGSFTLLPAVGRIRDTNGNTVGQWNIMEDDG